jgi:heme/copper-type cytochrome/quinol oxidase subunit 2
MSKFDKRLIVVGIMSMCLWGAWEIFERIKSWEWDFGLTVLLGFVVAVCMVVIGTMAGGLVLDEEEAEQQEGERGHEF